jgi:hypothetical protein
MLKQIMEESLKEVPNPDLMNYEQLQDLGDRMGTVSQGFTDA